MADERLALPGLGGPVLITIDRWGIPHIRAESDADLFFAQGFNAARDRLWQIDLWRKRGLGHLAADFGPGFLAQDWAARQFLYRGGMQAEWAAYGPDAEAICDAFTRGINAYIDLVERDPERLPPEFVALKSRPSKWAPEDVVRIRTHGWTRNAMSEILRANVLARANADVDQLRMNLEPRIAPHRAPGIDLSAIPMALLDTYKLATAPVIFTRDRLQAATSQAWEWTHVTPAGEVIRVARPHGSNNWAVHGTRTASGRPILATDPHRLHSVPSLRYLIHLTAPGIDVIGAGEPSFPGIAIGHNGHAAFGLTLFLGPDQEDVYVYETDPAHPNAYKYLDGWEEMRLVDETFAVLGGEPVRLTLKFTRHGPVVYEDPTNRLAFAIRSVWFESGTTPYGASLAGMRARTFDQFRGAMKLWRVPAVNQVYADRSGDIGWIAAGLSPVRRHWDGLLPVPGDGRYEWDGFLDPDLLPATRNPPAGFVASANAMNLPPDWSHRDRPIGYEWDDPSRAERLKEVLSADSAHSVESACALQADVVSLPARRLSALLDTLRPDDRDASKAVGLLRSWDCRLSAESGPAALFEMWWTSCLRPALLGRVVDDPGIRGLITPGDIESLLRLLEKRDPLPKPSRRLTVDRLLTTTLADAFRRCAAKMGSEPGAWSWGQLHGISFAHGLSTLDASLRVAPEVGPFSLPGSESTVMKAAYRPDDFRVVMGASVRIVMDVGEWDRSVWINAPGQSGDPRSPHYADLAACWAEGKYVPMLYSSRAVDEAADRRIILIPEV